MASSPTRRAMRTDARRNVEKLVAVARDAFAEHGADASLIDIARRAGVGSGTLYRHFPSRSALLLEVYRQEIEALGALAATLRDAVDPFGALAEWLRAFADYTTRCRGLKGLIAAADAETDTSVAGWWRETVLGAAIQLLDRAQRSGAARADITAIQVLRLVNAVALAHELAGADDSAGPVLTVVIDGLRGQDRRAAGPASG